MEKESIKGIPMVMANEVQIDFKLTRKNIENYRDVFDESTVITLMWEEDEEEQSKCWVGGDLCDVLYQIWEFIEDNDITEYQLYYFNHWDIKNSDDDHLDLLWAIAVAYHSIYDEDVPEIGCAAVCLEDNVCFILKNNSFDEEIKQKEFDELWNS